MPPNSPAERVAANVRAELSRHRRTQRQAADHLGVSQAYVSRRLSGRVPFDVEELSSLAAWLGVPLAILIGEDMAA